MATFTELDWRRLDLFALVFGRGMASVEKASWQNAMDWLSVNEYETVLLDFSSGISPVVEQLGHQLKWVENFGYELLATSRNLAALNDGFDFEVPDEGGLCILIENLSEALVEDRSWSDGFLSIISEHSLRHLACGRRFFALLQVMDGESPEVGHVYENLSVPYPFPLLHGTAAA